MSEYTIIDICGGKHVILADQYKIVNVFDKEIITQFFINGKVCGTFVVRNIISITECKVDNIEVMQFEDNTDIPRRTKNE